MHMQNLLVADKVSKNYGDFRALNQLSIEVPKQSIFGILGPNGAGKTTFIRIVNQITMPDEGKILLDGEPPRLLRLTQQSTCGGVFYGAQLEPISEQSER